MAGVKTSTQFNLQSYPTYVINLERRPDRLDTFISQPAVSQFTSFRRFDAVDGSKLDIFNDKRVSLHIRQNIKRKIRRSHYEINTPGAIGASLSHIGIWEEFLKSDAEYCVVFEDDTVLTAKEIAKINNLAITGPPEWDMWLLGTHKWAFKGKPINRKSPEAWWSVTDFTGAHAYVLTKRGAKILLEQPFPIETHIEYYICACAELRGLKLVRHAGIRMTYFAEVAEEADSDTFDSIKSCPTCYIPDDFYEHGFYLSYWKLNRMLVGLAAVGVVGYAWWRSTKN
jgi:hypothetical protein